MSSGAYHYREAERMIAAGVYDEDGDERLLDRDIALAQVHATLALAAATAEAGGLATSGSLGLLSSWAHALSGETRQDQKVQS